VTTPPPYFKSFHKNQGHSDVGSGSGTLYTESAASQLQWQGDEWAFLRMPSLIFMRIRGQLGYLSQPAQQPA